MPALGLKWLHEEGNANLKREVRPVPPQHTKTDSGQWVVAEHACLVIGLQRRRALARG